MYKSILISLVLLCNVTLSASAENIDRSRKRTGGVEVLLPDALPHVAPKERIVSISQPSKIEVKGGFCNTQFMEGIDVSHYQGQIDWQRVANEGKVSYAYIKASEGADLVDDCYQRNIHQAREAGLSVGAYHFYRPQRGAEANYSNMISVIKREHIDLVPIIDIESTGNLPIDQFQQDLRDFIRKVTRHYGKKPMLYTGQNFYNKYLQSFMPDHIWMIAKYQEEAPILQDGNMCFMWQYSQTGRIPGIRGNVDRSCLMYGNTLHSALM